MWLPMIYRLSINTDEQHSVNEGLKRMLSHKPANPQPLMFLQVHSMAKQPAAERSAAFVPSQPGNFISISNKTGKYQLLS